MLISQDRKSAELIRPILRGRDIKRYGYEFNNLWLINCHNGIKNKNIAPVDINDYPAIKSYLDNFYDKLQKRSDKGITPYNLRNCVYMDEFFKPKIIYPNMTKYLPFIYDDTGFMTNQKCFVLTSKSEIINLKYLVAFLNSSLAKKWIIDNCPELLGGTRELSKIFFENILIPDVSKELKQKMSLIAEKYLIGKNDINSYREGVKLLDDNLFSAIGLSEVEKSYIYECVKDIM